MSALGTRGFEIHVSTQSLNILSIKVVPLNYLIFNSFIIDVKLNYSRLNSKK